MPTTYLTRPQQRAYLEETHGIPLGKTALENMASDGEGPKYVLINGKALSTRDWLDEWVAKQASRPVTRRRRVRAQQDHAA
jgi:hypothetical protein